jgi:hypothetical protein
VLSVITLGQTFLYEVGFSQSCNFDVQVFICVTQRGHKQAVSSFSAFFIAITSMGVAVLAVAASFGSLAWLDLLYYLSYLKLIISFIKFMPQAWLNYKRRSTIGWSIHNILLVSFCNFARDETPDS